ncbi:MAG: leucine-rich repeat domain-containing protein, partial [Flavobacteriales bacterium]|nr:leucine-rich repeat domain-containing protein [Flavobacteriales bacterium]
MSELALQLIAENKKTKGRLLDLGRCGLLGIPVEVLQLTWLEELNFCNEWGEWQNGKYRKWNSDNLGEPNHIEGTVDLAPLVNLQKLKFGGYFPDYWPIQSLDFAKNIRYLRMSFCIISDVSPLKELNSLQSLNFGRNQVSDLSPLKELKSLQSLDFSGNQVSDLSPLKELNSLQSLDFKVNQVSDVSPLKELNSLQSLD